MILCLDVGNSHIYGGVYSNDKFVVGFRYNSSAKSTSDELGLFFLSVLRENGVDPKAIKKIAISSVVPTLVYSLKACCTKYFNIQAFILQAGVKTGLQIKYRNPLEVGADRIANCIAGAEFFPNKNLIICDFGTATTFCVLTKNRDYLGGAIIPGLRLAMESLVNNTAQLPSVEIVKPKNLVGRSTIESIQSGLYHSHLYSVKGMVEAIKEQYFAGEETLVLGTGGFARLYESEKLFDQIIPNLVLDGLIIALKNNH